MPDDWDPFHHFAVGVVGPWLPVVTATVAGGAAAVAAAGAVAVVVAAVEGRDYSLNKESQTLMHDEKFELHDENVPKT